MNPDIEKMLFLILIDTATTGIIVITHVTWNNYNQSHISYWYYCCGWILQQYKTTGEYTSNINNKVC